MKNKVCIFKTNTDKTDKVLKMLLDAGFSMGGEIDYELFNKECIALLIGYKDATPSSLYYVTAVGTGGINESNGYELFCDNQITPELIQQFRGSKPVKKDILIDFHWLSEHNACEDGFKWFVAKYGIEKVKARDVLEELAKQCKSSWFVWLEGQV